MYTLTHSFNLHIFDPVGVANLNILRVPMSLFNTVDVTDLVPISAAISVVG
jgi:hypothetical protein